MPGKGVAGSGFWLNLGNNATMKKILAFLPAILLAGPLLAQVSGNINYQQQVRFPDNNINVNLSGNADFIISVKGLANVKADTYVAIFHVSQTGKTTEEVNKLADERIAQALKNIQSKPGVETYIDMISFVPVYQFVQEEKVFSKKTYNEIPAGFEVRKNIHIRYSDPDLLNEVIAAFSNAEIYDLVRVDYFSNNLEAVKKELMAKATTLMKEKIKTYEGILGIKTDSIERQFADGYKVVLPVEMYNSYQSYSSSSLNLKKPANVNQAEKTTTLYYQPIIDKEFDFVLNPSILEPVIQVMYELKLKINRGRYLAEKEAEKERAREKPPVQKAEKEYFFITPNGELKNLNIMNE